MRPTVYAIVLVLVSASFVWAAGPRPQPATAVAEQMVRYDRNAALGEALSTRPGKPDELQDLQTLADEGLSRARALAAKYPESAEVSYLLGSWLLYGYRVVEETRTTVDEEGVEHATPVQTVVQGLGDGCEEGLEALKRATVLEPGRGKYLVDYGAALFDCGRGPEAQELLRAAWFGQPQLAVGERTQVGILLSKIALEELRPKEAREWAYSALAARPENVVAMQRLRRLDAAVKGQAEAASATPAESGAAGDEGVGPE